MNEQFQSCILLGVKPDASVEEIKRAYRQLARKWHPDRIQDERKRAIAEERLREINRAYDTLIEWQAARERLKPNRPPKSGDKEPAPIYDTVEWVRSAAEQASLGQGPEEDFPLYERALSLHFEGVKHFRAARWVEAVSCLMQSVCLVQNNPEAYLMLGTAYHRMGKPAKAASAYQQALRIEPRSAEAHHGLGEVYVAMGDFDAACREQKALERLDSDLAEALSASILRASSERG